MLKIEAIKQANELIEEYENLKRYKKFLEDRECGDYVNFQVRQNAADVLSEDNVIVIPQKYNNDLFMILDSIILDLGQQIKNLKI